MAKLPGALRRHVRTAVQLGWTALTNGYAAGFAKGTIYKGELKRVCVPGLNCYSCPGALGSCPIGSLQAVRDIQGLTLGTVFVHVDEDHLGEQTTLHQRKRRRRADETAADNSDLLLINH